MSTTCTSLFLQSSFMREITSDHLRVNEVAQELLLNLLRIFFKLSAVEQLFIQISVSSTRVRPLAYNKLPAILRIKRSKLLQLDDERSSSELLILSLFSSSLPLLFNSLNQWFSNGCHLSHSLREEVLIPVGNLFQGRIGRKRVDVHTLNFCYLFIQHKKSTARLA